MKSIARLLILGLFALPAFAAHDDTKYNKDVVKDTDMKESSKDSKDARKQLEKERPSLVAARDNAVVQQKRERLQQELAARSARQSNSLRI